MFLSNTMWKTSLLFSSLLFFTSAFITGAELTGGRLEKTKTGPSQSRSVDREKRFINTREGASSGGVVCKSLFCFNL
jgi:hypothetical protein